MRRSGAGVCGSLRLCGVEGEGPGRAAAGRWAGSGGGEARGGGGEVAGDVLELFRRTPRSRDLRYAAASSTNLRAKGTFPGGLVEIGVPTLFVAFAGGGRDATLQAQSVVLINR